MSSRDAFMALRRYLQQHILGQETLVERLLIALLADGHLLVEGVPGLAKTKAIVALAEGLDASFQRIQFTPDLLPADITGSDIYRPAQGTFEFQAGPIFHNLILADEINRAPAKVQSALLEAMAEQQVSVGQNSYALPEIFLVMATQNPIEQEGTYPLPEAQTDRFLLKVNVDYPDAATERKILQLTRQQALQLEIAESPQISCDTLVQARQEIWQIHVASAIEEYIVQLIIATRSPEKFNAQLAQWLSYGASPRGTIALERCARAHAWLAGRDFVTPEDVQALLFDVLRHRVILSFEAHAQGVNVDNVLQMIIDSVPVT
ncbi:MoxR family ATPase [Pseudomonas sp. F1_0610]|uniref:AAA family ATPase n=1 Tax=Pseudomonas sp. F1_0610 TaxID=3114284 RepID=UPI0039C46D45